MRRRPPDIVCTLLQGVREAVAPWADVPDARLEAAMAGEPGEPAMTPPMAKLQLSLRRILAEYGTMDAEGLN